MTSKMTFHALGFAAVALAIGAMTVSAEAQTRRDRGEVPVGATNRQANSSYMAGPRTRVYVTKRSWLDMGTEVLPGERKYSDYAYPPGILNSTYYNTGRGPGSYGPRQPLNPPYDMGGYPSGIPLY